VTEIPLQFYSFHLRLQGGGVYLPQVWYDACDRLGVLVFHDMMFAQQGHAPTNDATEEQELRHNIRRLAHHASIVLWDGCNESVATATRCCCGICGVHSLTVVALAAGALW
jgi:beta-galactosidase/beta-glucuronidase